ncbi:MAG: TonB-dependent receptor [Gemmatimonadota bacterium]
MDRVRRVIRIGAAALLVFVGAYRNSAAQGVTSAAVQGQITREGGGSVEGANILLTNTSTGVRVVTQSRANGRYNIENVQVGGPYTIEARGIGFEPASKSGVMLALGQRYTTDFTLKTQIVTLQELTVNAVTSGVVNSNRTGPAQFISDTAIQRYPLLGRNFTSLLQSSPQVTPVNGSSGVSIGGQSSRFNTIQVDGGVNNDVFGLSATGGTPGGSASAKTLSLEALKEFQILTAPFDIRQGSFSGGLINAVTKSGTNQFRGSLFGYLQRPELVGKDTADARINTFQIKQYGGTLGGPIIRNRLHFFASADIQSSETPFVGANVVTPSVGISAATADRVTQILRTKYNFDPGTFAEPVLDRPDKNLFGKLTLAVGTTGLLDLSHNFVDASDDNLSRGPPGSGARNRNNRDGFQLSKSGYTFNSKTNSTRLKYTGAIGGTSIDAMVSRMAIRDARQIPNRVPLILVQDATNNFIAAGSEKFSQANSLDQDVYEATVNGTWSFGNHRVTLGTHNEFFKFRNVFFAGSLGVWTFNSADLLDAGTANRYEISLPTAARPEGPISNFSVKQLGGYAQDQWNPTERLTVTLGLRVDVPYSDKPATNPALAAANNATTNGGLGINTSNFPTGNPLVSPRVGFNFDADGQGSTIVRGGVGIFSGRPPYVWLSNAFTNTGLEQVILTCDGTPGKAVPTFTTDVDNLPKVCAGGAAATPGIASINYFDPDFKFQQALKFAIGIDRKLPWGVVATLDFLHTRQRNQLYLTDDNLTPQAPNAEGRLMYGTISATGSVSPAKKTTAFGQVVRHENRSKDWSSQFTAQLQKRFANGVEFSAAYTYTRVRDLFTLGSDIATSNLANTTLDGTLAERNLRPAAYEIPHKVTLSGTANLAFGLSASLIYSGRSGTPYGYNVSGDANADGMTTNDLVFVPATAADISLTNGADFDRLNAYIAGEPCLQEQRGRIIDRNSCRNPWQSFLNFRLSKVIPTVGSQGLEVTADVFNLLNMVNSEWGLIRLTNTFENLALLNLAGYDPVANRPKYSVPTVFPSLQQVQTLSSRWRIQLGAKYVF